MRALSAGTVLALSLATLTALTARPARADERQAAHALLRQRYPDYRAAVAAFEAGAANAADFERIAAAAGDLPLKAHATFFLGRAALEVDDFDRACAAFERVRGELRGGTPWEDEATLYLAYSLARRPELDAAKEKVARERAGDLLELLAGPRPLYPSCPERVRELARWLLRELTGEGSGPLLELGRRMDGIESAIDRTETGPSTQRRQEAVISELDRLIELMREKERPAREAGPRNGEPGRRDGSTPAPRPGPRQPETSRELPALERDAPDSLPGLRGKDREKALQLLKEMFPARYKDLVEQYFKSLAERDSRRSSR